MLVRFRFRQGLTTPHECIRTVMSWQCHNFQVAQKNEAFRPKREPLLSRAVALKTL